MTKLKNVVVLDEKKLKAIAEGEVKFDGRHNNTGRPVNKKSNRQKRLAKQAFYADVNTKFQKGNQFEIKTGVYKYLLNCNSTSAVSSEDGLGCIVNVLGYGHYVCNVSYIGRTKVKGFTYVLGKLVNVELDLKTLKFVE